MDYNKDNIVNDKAKTWKTFNKLTIFTIVFVAIILIIKPSMLTLKVYLNASQEEYKKINLINSNITD